MEIKVKIIELKTINELDFYWEIKDYKNLLQEFDYPDAEQIKENEILKICLWLFRILNQQMLQKSC